LDTYDYIRGMESIGEIFVMGFSYGTAPAVYTTAKRDAAGLILLAPFDNGANLLNGHLNIFHGPLKLLVKNRLESDTNAASVDEPVMITVSNTDTVVVNKLSENLSACFPLKPEYNTVSGLTHNELIYDASVMRNIADFIKQNTQS
jgi:uncharacterized protein